MSTKSLTVEDMLSSMMDRAELCFERGQTIMVVKYLQEIDRRTPDDEMPGDLADRFNSLSESLMDEYGIEWQTASKADRPMDESPRANNQCQKCGGSRIYRYASGTIGTCFDCEGKGFQTEADIVRVKNYWARRRGEVASKRAAAATQQGMWPF